MRPSDAGPRLEKATTLVALRTLPGPGQPPLLAQVGGVAQQESDEFTTDGHAQHLLMQVRGSSQQGSWICGN